MDLLAWGLQLLWVVVYCGVMFLALGCFAMISNAIDDRMKARRQARSVLRMELQADQRKRETMRAMVELTRRRG